jgi:beta-ribofuranosylaminobenzene 5'-phosphate synthase
MHNNGYRQNGGIGFAIDTPTLEIHFKQADMLSIEDTRSRGFNDNEKKRILDILKDESHKMSFDFGFEATIKGDVPTHMGFGSSTAVRLALIEGLYLINKKEYIQEDIVKISERGGVSGIGIETYFRGGLVFDMGRASKSDFVPSSAMEEKEKTLPLVCKRVDMPKWQIGICIPHVEPKTEEEEKVFFTKICPIKKEESYKTLYHVTYGVLASVVEEDKHTFEEAIKQIQHCHWKSAERSLYGDVLLKEEKILYECGAKAVGMSSLGASLYFIADDVNDVMQKAKIKLEKSKFFVANTNNIGRSINYD